MINCRECNRVFNGYLRFTQISKINDYFCEFCMPSSWPERLNPEDHIGDINDMICDSPNLTNK